MVPLFYLYCFTDDDIVSSPIDSDGVQRLYQIGNGLDRDEFPVIYQNGLVLPGPASASLNSPGMEQETYEGSPEAWPAGSEPGQRTWPAGQGPPGSSSGARSPTSAALLVRGAGVSNAVQLDLGATIAEYTSTRVTVAQNLIWMLVPIDPIPSLPEKPLILVAYPLSRWAWPKAWGWWDYKRWIGPRHTNYDGTGSICSFEVSHGTWKPGRPLLQLLDLHVGWTVRHLHLNYFGRWPGRQVIHTARERLREHREGELCGGCDSLKLYEHCCRPKDLKQTSLARDSEYRRYIKNPIRQPPDELQSVVRRLMNEPVASNA